MSQAVLSWQIHHVDSSCQLPGAWQKPGGSNKEVRCHIYALHSPKIFDQKNFEWHWAHMHEHAPRGGGGGGSLPSSSLRTF